MRLMSKRPVKPKALAASRTACLVERRRKLIRRRRSYRKRLITSAWTAGSPSSRARRLVTPYIFDLPEDDAIVFHDADPAVVEEWNESYERDPCTYFDSSGQAMLAADQLYVRTIDVPVLLMYGDHDLFTPTDGQIQLARYAGTTDKTLEVILNAGHLLPLENAAPAVVEKLSSWLAARGY